MVGYTTKRYGASQSAVKCVLVVVPAAEGYGLPSDQTDVRISRECRLDIKGRALENAHARVAEIVCSGIGSSRQEYRKSPTWWGVTFRRRQGARPAGASTGVPRFGTRCDIFPCRRPDRGLVPPAPTAEGEGGGTIFWIVMGPIVGAATEPIVTGKVPGGLIGIHEILRPGRWQKTVPSLAEGLRRSCGGVKLYRGQHPWIERLPVTGFGREPSSAANPHQLGGVAAGRNQLEAHTAEPKALVGRTAVNFTSVGVVGVKLADENVQL